MVTATRQTNIQTNIVVRELAAPGDWQGFLEDRDGTLYHDQAWDDVFQVYGLPTIRLVAWRGERIEGVLPLVCQKSLLFDNQLVSLPWFDTAGLIADSEEAASALIDAACDRARKRRVKTVQLREGACREGMKAGVRTDKVLLRRDLDPDPEVVWTSFKPRVRNQVRKAEKCGLKVQSGGAELIGEFFSVYSTNMRDLGSPPHSLRLFERVAEKFEDRMRIYVVRRGMKTTIGAGLTLGNGTSLEIPWASSLQSYNGFCVNHLMYWTILEDACKAGYRRFHFGRSTPGTGPYKFKKQWGADDVPLYWYFVSADQSSDHEVINAQESFGWGSRLWQKLPLPVSNFLGPRIISRVP